MSIGKYYQLSVELSYISIDTHVSSIDRDLSLLDEERERESEWERKRKEKDSNKQSTALGYIDIISSNNFC